MARRALAHEKEPPMGLREREDHVLLAKRREESRVGHKCTRLSGSDERRS